MVSCFPWQREQWQRLTHAMSTGQLGHANLFSGRQGSGNEEFAHDFAKLLLCEQRTSAAPNEAPSSLQACNECRGCQLTNAGNHPDLLHVCPEEEGKGIGVDQIRALSGFYSLKSHYAGNKIAIVSPADAMNRAAANAILKTLEEPPEQAFLMLVTDRFDAIPMTVRSRCQRLAFEHIDQNIALQWLTERCGDESEAQNLLNASLGAPLSALAMRESDEAPVEQELRTAWGQLAERKIGPLEASKQCAAFPLKKVIEELLRLTYLMIVAKFGVGSAFSYQDEKPNGNLQAPLNGLNLKDLYAILDVILEGKKLILAQANIRDSDLLDSIWIALDDTYQKSNGA